MNYFMVYKVILIYKTKRVIVKWAMIAFQNIFYNLYERLWFIIIYQI